MRSRVNSQPAQRRKPDHILSTRRTNESIVVHSATVKWPLSHFIAEANNSIMTRNMKVATRKVKNVHMFDTSTDTVSVDLCESHEGRQSLCQSLRRCLLLTCQKSFLLIRGGRVWAVLINSPAGPSGKSVSFSQKEKARQESQFPFLLPGGQESHFPSPSLSLNFLLCCPSLSSVLLYLHLLSLSPFSVIWRLGGTRDKYLMHSRWNNVMKVLDKHFCAHHEFALQLQLEKKSLATAACSGSRQCL